MPCTAQILVTLRNADPTALTAKSCLQRWLGYGERLRDLRRGVLWELTASEEADVEGGLSLVRTSGELWNPNKEVATTRMPGASDVELVPPGCDSPARWRFVLAWDPERDIDRPLRSLREARDRGMRLARGTLWALRWDALDEAEVDRLTIEAARCRGPREGLLVHPHLEDHRIVAATLAPPWLPRATG
ncbi:MAG: hypothetical protein FJY88_01875 [Candidatus Eisenbacteria bacterium]|nr:hypothetical protein [Candidatus Eisenbacteria bacterium]